MFDMSKVTKTHILVSTRSTVIKAFLPKLQISTVHLLQEVESDKGLGEIRSCPFLCSVWGTMSINAIRTIVNQ